MRTSPHSDLLGKRYPQLESLLREEKWEEIVPLLGEIISKLSTECEDRTVHLAALLSLVEALCRIGRVAEADEVQARNEGLAASCGDLALRARWDLNSCLAHYRRGDCDAAEARAHMVLAAADLLGESDDLRLAARSNLGLIAMHRGEWTTARRHQIAALDAARRLGSAIDICQVLVNNAVSQYWGGSWSSSLEDCVAVISCAADAGDRALLGMIASVHILRGNIQRIRGQRELARQSFDAAKGAAESIGWKRESLLADELAADLAYDDGNYEEATALLENIIKAGLKMAPEGDLVYEGRRKLAQVALARGLARQARELAQNALALARKAGTVVEMGASLRVLAEAHATLDDMDAARQAADEGIQLLRSRNERYELAQLLIVAAEWRPDAKELLAEARELATILEIPSMIEDIDVRLGQFASGAQPAGLLKGRQVYRRYTQDGRLLMTTDSRLLHDLDRASRNRSRVFIHGEPGTGKELLARLVHENGPRAKAKFLAVECTSLHETLGQSELFGYQKGAFTGALTDRKGLVEFADGGTLFLDEVGDLPLSLQGALLRFLQEREFRPVGGHSARSVDTRVISATNRDLLAMVEAGTFRRDLYDRLQGAVIHVAPLRERPDDIIPLAEHYMQVYCEQYDVRARLHGRVLDVFQRYSWPGNVRELSRTIEDLVSQLPAGETIADLRYVRADIVTEAKHGPGRAKATFRARMDSLLFAEAQRALTEYGGSRSQAAEALGFSRRGFQKLMKRLGLEREKDDLSADGGDDELL